MMRQVADAERKKPKQARALATREAILDAAAQILARSGEAGLTTNRIAERAGVSVGSVYQYFADKDAILLALINRERTEIGARIAIELADARPQDAEDVARRVIGAVIEAFRARRGRRRLVTLAMLRLSADASGGAEMLDRMSALILAASQAHPGATARPLTPVAAYVLTRAVMGAVRAAMLEDSDVLDDPAFAEELVRLAVVYLRA